MSLNNLIALKIVAIILSDNIILKLVVFCLLIYEIFKRKNIRVVKNKKDLIIGSSLIVLNTIINIDFSFVNFLFLVVMSSFVLSFKLEKFINYYLVLVSMKGCVYFCLSL